MMRSWFILLSAGLVLALAASAARALDHVWIVGGGPVPHHSQAQIEFNVNWVIQVLNAKPEARQLHVYYTDGKADGRDVVAWQAPAETKDSLQPLARVFGRHWANGERFYDHRVPNVRGGTEATELKSRLEQEFAELKPGDRALFIFNGHGARDHSDPAGNTLYLWNNSSLSVRELDQIMGRIDPSVPVRFVFTQCYSGGFARLTSAKNEDTLVPGGANRCGFFAEAEDRESEGCSASITVDDYRDYSTYFFAALHGRTRTGEVIDRDPDRNADGVVSLSEAHWYALSQGHNADLPRATSEVFLERWQPWYLRWADTGAEPENVYGTLAREVARRNGLPESGHALIRELRKRRATQRQQLDGLEREQHEVERQIRFLQHQIRSDLGMRWPEALTPYTLNFVQFLKKDLNAAQDYILAHPRYPELVTAQKRSDTLNQDILHLDRDITQLDKILRLRLLARLLNRFERHATAQEREWYRRLKACEGQPL